MAVPTVRRAKERRRSSTSLAVATVILIVLAGLAGTAIYHFLYGSSAHASVVWRTTGAGLDVADERSIDGGLIAARDAGEPALAIGGAGSQPQFVIIQVQRSGHWAVLNAVVRASRSGGVIAAEPVFFIAHHQGSGWALAFPGSAAFCGRMHQLPPELVHTVDYKYFGC